jgi:hypothetical protein
LLHVSEVALQDDPWLRFHRIVQQLCANQSNDSRRPLGGRTSAAGTARCPRLTRPRMRSLAFASSAVR